MPSHFHFSHDSWLIIPKKILNWNNYSPSFLFWPITTPRKKKVYFVIKKYSSEHRTLSSSHYIISPLYGSVRKKKKSFCFFHAHTYIYTLMAIFRCLWCYLKIIKLVMMRVLFCLKIKLTKQKLSK